jgi:hypothetical protein
MARPEASYPKWCWHQGGDLRQKIRERLAPQGGLQDGQNVVLLGRSGHRGDHHLARRPGAAVAVLDHADFLASATPLLDAHAPVNMPNIISKEAQMAEGKCHVEIVYCVV